jgi:hypothetical protein
MLCTSVTRDGIGTDCSAILLTEQMVSASLFHWDRQRRNHDVCQWLWGLYIVFSTNGFVDCDHYFVLQAQHVSETGSFSLHVKQWEDTKSNWPNSTDSPFTSSPVQKSTVFEIQNSGNTKRMCQFIPYSYIIFHLFVEGLKVYYYSNILNIEFVNVNFQTLQKVKERTFCRRVQNRICLLYYKHKLQQGWTCTSL